MVKKGLPNQFLSELFDLWNIEYNLLRQKDFSLGAEYTTNYGLQSWGISLQKFGIWHKQILGMPLICQIHDGCPCKLCRAYICQVGYIN